MISGVFLGVLTWASMVATFMHFPKSIQKFFLNHFLITDLLSVVITFIGLSSISKSLTGLIGCITCGLLVNITLITNKKLNAG